MLTRGRLQKGLITRENKGFTLIESLVAMLMISIVTALVVGGTTTALHTYRRLKFVTEADMLAANIDTAIAPMLRFSDGTAQVKTVQSQDGSSQVLVLVYGGEERRVLNDGVYTDCSVYNALLTHSENVMTLSFEVESLVDPGRSQDYSFVYRRAKDFSAGSVQTPIPDTNQTPDPAPSAGEDDGSTGKEVEIEETERGTGTNFADPVQPGGGNHEMLSGGTGGQGGNQGGGQQESDGWLNGAGAQGGPGSRISNDEAGKGASWWGGGAVDYQWRKVSDTDDSGVLMACFAGGDYVSMAYLNGSYWRLEQVSWWNGNVPGGSYPQNATLYAWEFSNGHLFDGGPHYYNGAAFVWVPC